jgi:hypothetical protein
VTDVDLAEFDDEFSQSEVSEDSFEPIPNGKYQTEVESVELSRTLKGDPTLKWTLKVLGPTHSGRKLWRNNIIASPDNVSWLKKDLLTCGLRLQRLSELPANLDRLLDLRLEVTVKSRVGDDGKSYQSVYLNKRIKTADDAQGGSRKTDDALSRF